MLHDVCGGCDTAVWRPLAAHCLQHGRGPDRCPARRRQERRQLDEHWMLDRLCRQPCTRRRDPSSRREQYRRGMCGGVHRAQLLRRRVWRRVLLWRRRREDQPSRRRGRLLDDLRWQRDRVLRRRKPPERVPEHAGEDQTAPGGLVLVNTLLSSIMCTDTPFCDIDHLFLHAPLVHALLRIPLFS
jgi:hypothetical protein